VLLIEDADDIVELVSNIFEDEGFAYSVATDGEAGLAVAYSWAPDLILLDLSLPKLSGWDVRDVGNLRYPNRSRLLLVQTDERCCARGKTWDDGPDRVDENILDRHSPDAAGQRPPPLCGTDGARMRAGWSTAGRTRVGLESRDDPQRRS